MSMHMCVHVCLFIIATYHLQETYVLLIFKLASWHGSLAHINGGEPYLRGSQVAYKLDIYR